MLYVKQSALAGVDLANARMTASIFTDSFTYPSVNIVAKVTGRDPKLRDEYVLFSAHQDHDGERYTVNGDNIWNGRTTMRRRPSRCWRSAGRCQRPPGRRSALFIWHGSEERGPDGIAVVREAPDRAAEIDRRLPQRRHDGPERSKSAALLGRAPATSQLAGAR
jgi:hypothetical protein